MRVFFNYRRWTVAVLLLLGLVLCWQAGGCSPAENRPEAKKVVVEQEGKIVYEAVLDVALTGEEDGELLSFVGAAGEYVVEIRGGKVRMFAAQCPDKLCVHQSWTQRASRPIICLPQKIVIYVEEEDGAEETGIDALVR